MYVIAVSGYEFSVWHESFVNKTDADVFLPDSVISYNDTLLVPAGETLSMTITLGNVVFYCVVFTKKSRILSSSLVICCVHLYMWIRVNESSCLRCTGDKKDASYHLVRAQCQQNYR